MQFESLFLDKTAQLKLTLLQALRRNAPCGTTIADLSNQLHQTYQRTYNLFQELLNDLATMTGEAPTALRKPVMSGHSPIALDAYRFYLLHAAIAYEFFDYVVQGHQPNTDRFCGEHFVSRSTLTRKTAPLRRFLTHYNLKLSTTTATITGREAGLRLCLQVFYWQATHGTSWPFATIDQTALAHQLALAPGDPLTRQQLMYLVAISRLRLAQDHHLAGMTPVVLAAPAYFTTAGFPQLSAPQLKAENQFIACYQVVGFRFDALTELAPIAAQTPAATRLAADLRHALASGHDPALRRLAETPLFRQNLFRAALSFWLFQGNYVKFSDFGTPKLSTPKLVAFTRRLAQLLPTLPATAANAGVASAQAAFCRTVAFLAAPDLQATTPDDAVTVSLQLNINNLLHRGLLVFLHNLTFVQCLPASAIGHYDLLITEADSQPASAEATATMTWCLDVTETDFHHLYQTLCHLYRQKLVAPDAG